MSPRPSGRRIHSIYLDEFEDVAVRLVADENRQSPNAVCRALIRRALGLPAVELRVPERVAEWADRQRAATAAGRDLAG